MAFPGIVQTRRSLHEREIRAGILAVAAMLVMEIVAVRWLLATARGSVTTGWVSVAIAGWTLLMGILGWLMATRRDAGLIFLWAMVLAGTVSLAGGIASSGGSDWVGRGGYAALAFLSAVTIHFHVIFPRKMRPSWRRAVLAAAYGFAGMLALAWVFYPVPFSNNLRLLSRAFFGLSGLLAWARMFYVGRCGGGLEEKWVGRWLSLVLFVGGLIPAWGYLMSQVVLGQPMISLPTAFLFEMAIPLGYFVMVERYEPWREGKSVPRIVSGVVVAMAEATALVCVGVGVSCGGAPRNLAHDRRCSCDGHAFLPFVQDHLGAGAKRPLWWVVQPREVLEEVLGGAGRSGRRGTLAQGGAGAG